MRTPRYLQQLAVALACLAVVGGCSGGSTSGDAAEDSPTVLSTAVTSPTAAASTASPASPQPTAPQVRTIAIKVIGRQVIPAPRRVDLRSGERLRLELTSDHDDQVHVHGFEIERDLPANTPVSVDLVGGAPGLYEVETHRPALRVLQIAVR